MERQKPLSEQVDDLFEASDIVLHALYSSLINIKADIKAKDPEGPSAIELS